MGRARREDEEQDEHGTLSRWYTYMFLPANEVRPPGNQGSSGHGSGSTREPRLQLTERRVGNRFTPNRPLCMLRYRAGLAALSQSGAGAVARPNFSAWASRRIHRMMRGDVSARSDRIYICSSRYTIHLLKIQSHGNVSAAGLHDYCWTQEINRPGVSIQTSSSSLQRPGRHGAGFRCCMPYVVLCTYQLKPTTDERARRPFFICAWETQQGRPCIYA
jgi:hypothetical protein